MDQNEMDKRFRELIQNDDSALNDQEQTSKVDIWAALDVQKRTRVFPFWKIAASILFLLWAGTSWYFSNKINQQKAQYAQLEQEFGDANNKLLALEQNANKTSETIAPEQQMAQNTTTIKKPKPRNNLDVLQKEYIETIVYVHDTIWVKNEPNVSNNIQLVKDTVFIEIPAKAPIKFTSVEEPPATKDIKKATKKKRKSIEFVFNKKPLPKPIQKSNLIIINENELAKKDTNQNKGLITIPHHQQ